MLKPQVILSICRFLNSIQSVYLLAYVKYILSQSRPEFLFLNALGNWCISAPSIAIIRICNFERVPVEVGIIRSPHYPDVIDKLTYCVVHIIHF